MDLCFPQVHALIDWQVAPVFLDTELQQIAPANARGRRTVDKLVKVRLKDGRDQRLLIHVEVQAQRVQQFELRMWLCHYRIRDRWDHPLISLAVLADDQPNWKPTAYHAELGGCVLHFQFPVFKVSECADPVGVFERTGNVFALLVAAHQVGMATRHDPAGRSAGRFRLVKYLYRHGLSRQQVVDLFRLIEWLTRLPKEWELQFQGELATFAQNETRMATTETLLTFIERKAQAQGRRLGLQKGRQEGWQEGRQEGQEEGRRIAILDALETRFGPLPAAAIKQVQSLSGGAALQQALRAAIGARSLAQFRRSL